jgi:hypothetical protein
MKDRKLLFFSWDVFAAIALIILGWFFRIREFLANRSLWLDEAMLALNLVQRDLFELFLPLDYDQGAPLGFLVVQKVIILLLGENELRLRLFPLAVGCLVLVFAYLLAKIVFSTAGMLFFLAIMALSPGLIYYSAEVKQYSSDVLIIVFLLWLWSERLSIEKKQTSFQDFFSSRKVSFWLLIVGAFAIWFSHPAVFALAAIGVIWFLDTMFSATRRGDALKFMVLVGVTWLISFLLLYWVSLRALARNEFLSNYWQENFVQFNLGWFQQSVNNLFSDVAELGPHLWLFLIISFLGVIYLWKSQKQFLGTILLIFAFTLLASALNKYPFYGRLMLFSVPLLFLLLAAGVDAIFSISRRFSWLWGGLGAVCAFAVLYYPLSTSVERYNSPRYYDHIRPAIVYFSKNFQPGDTLYVYYWTVPVVRYYSFFHPYSEEDIFPGVSTSPSGMFSEVQELSDDERVWLVFSHLSRRRQENMEQMLLLLDQNGEKKDSFSILGTGVFLYLYDLSPK